MPARSNAFSPAHARDFTADRRLAALCLAGLVVGALSTVAAWVLLGAIHFFTNLFYFRTFSLVPHTPAEAHLGLAGILVPVIGGLIVGVIARFGSDKIRGHGIPEALESILFGGSRMSPRVALLKPLASGIAIGSGGPFGAEGPIIMTGGAAASLLAQLLHLSAAERKSLLVAGACAGMTAVFGTPLAAILLGVELLLFELRPRSLLPVSVACGVAGLLRPLWANALPLFELQTGAVSVIALPSCIVAGLCSGALAAGASRLVYGTEDAFERLRLHWMWWPALGGLAVGIGGWFEPRALGIGYDVINDLLHGHLLAWAAVSLLVVKLIIWAVALGSGTSGGVLAPVLMMGAGLGAVLGPWLPGGSIELWALVCMAATFGAAMGAPLAATVFAFGVTHDAQAMVAVILGCTAAHGFSVIVMHRSILTERIARRGRHVLREFGVDPLERRHVAEVMTLEVVTVPAQRTVAEILEGWFGPTQPHRAYPVVDGDRLLGMLDRELLSDLPPESADLPVSNLFQDLGPPQTISPQATCRAAATQLTAADAQRMAVTDPEGRLLGIVSRSDLLKPSQELHTEEVLRERTWDPLQVSPSDAPPSR